MSKCLYLSWIYLHLAFIDNIYSLFVMDAQKEIISKQKSIAKHYSFENEIVLSSYDLALISFTKITKKSQSSINDFPKTTFVI